MEEQKELNYKDAYYFLFNEMTDLITHIQTLQSRAEKICINEALQVQTESDKEDGTPE